LSVEIPKVAIAFGTIGIPQGDVIDLRVHLGCTKEVGSFECLLQSWDKKYSPGGSSPINVGMDGHIDIGRGANVPQVLTCRVESVKYESSPTENYVWVGGRCWGEKLFRRVVTKTYENKKGEEIVKDLLDYYVGLSHVRDGIELVENTDTTYTKLEYENTPVWDIVKYIAESADKAGVIGFDFRVAPDGRFEFFPKDSKTSPVNLSEKLEVCEYRKDIHRVRNKITAYGYAGRALPADKDAWTESLTGWVALDGTMSLDTVEKKVGSYSLMNNSGAGRRCRFYRTFPAESCESIALLKFWYGSWMYQADNWDWQVVTLYAPDSANYFQANLPYMTDVYWRLAEYALGPGNEYDANQNPKGVWTKVGNADWRNIQGILLDVQHKTETNVPIRIDGLFFDKLRYRATQEDSGSQSAYGLRELVEVDEELNSDNECMLRAKALLDYLKDPAEYLQLRTTVLDYGINPLLSGDKIHVTLPNENVDADFRVESVEYYVDAKSQTLEITLELGKVPPLLADYLYGLRATTVTVEKLARTKLGKKGLPFPSLGGGIGPHHAGHEAGDDAGVQWPSSDNGGWDKITGWICPKYVGPFNDEAAIINFRTKNKAGTVALDHQFNPSDDGHGILGSETRKWKEINTVLLLLPTDGYMRIRTIGEANPKAELSSDMLKFGPGGATAPDTWLKRVCANQFEISGDILPESNGARDIGNSLKKWRDVYLAGAIKALEGGVAVNLLPDVDATRDLGSSLLKWSNLFVNGLGRVGWLNIGDFTVITSARVLQNVTADASIITSGRFSLARLPVGTVGYVLEAQGALDPMYVDPNYRYEPKSHPHSAHTGIGPDDHHARDHNHAGENLSPNQVNCNTMSIAVSCNRQYTHPSSQQCVYASSVAWENCPRYYNPAAHTHTCSNSGVCGTIQDLVFANDFRITEAEKLGLGRGLAFLNPKGKVIMLLDEDGNIEISGKLKENTKRAAAA